MPESPVGGRLLVVGTPIGNLGDLSPRAAEALREADLIVAEDTRLAARLVAHIGARRPALSFNEHNVAARLPDLLARLRDGQTLALTTDAGMPAVSDPGGALVAAARGLGAAIEAIPGPSAVTSAMALAGVEATGFLFGGFLPARPVAARATRLRNLLSAAGSVGVPLVLFEAPRRVADLLDRVATEAPEVQVAAAREITKRHEETVVGTPVDVSARLAEPRGEFTLVISGIARPPAERGVDAGALLAAGRRLELSDRALVDILRGAGVARREAYRLVQEGR